MRELLLLEALADGHFHSGSQLGERLGISRAAVWKRLQQISQYGLDIESVRGKGYRLPGGLSLLDRDKILKHAGCDEASLSLNVTHETGSTNVDALYLARTTLDRPHALLAEYQSSGRGRRGRVWHSPFASSVYLSLAVQMPGGAPRMEGLSLAVGVVVAEVLEQYGVSGIGLKWPNDILVSGRKLGGILIELAGDLDSDCRAVIGVGLNGALPDSLQVDQPVTDLLRETGYRPDRNLLSGKLIRVLLNMVAEFSAQGFQAFRARWEKFDVLHGTKVTVWQGARAVVGVAQGVSGKGALMVRCDDGVHEFHGGEVTLKADARHSESH